MTCFTEFDFLANLHEMRNNFTKLKGAFLKNIPKPAWMESDMLNQTYAELSQLIELGEIHYACLVQANVILFKTFPPFNCPADILFSTDESFSGNPYELNVMANTLYRYKNTGEAPDELKKITDSITDEYERLYNIRLPDSFTGDKEIYFTTVMMFRKHLPKRKLISSLFPVLTNPAKLQSTIVLPKQYWTKDFIDFYCNKRYIGIP